MSARQGCMVDLQNTSSKLAVPRKKKKKKGLQWIMTVKLGNGRPGLCKWQDKSCAKVKMNCILRHNTGEELILHFPPRAPKPGAGDEKCEVCVSPGWGWRNTARCGLTQKLTESIKAGLSSACNLFIKVVLCFCFMLQWQEWVRLSWKARDEVFNS